MFLQIMQGKVRDADLFQQQGDKWRSDIKPGAIGYLGSTSGVSPDGTAVVLARFESADAARANSERPEQAQWWEKMAPAFDGEVTFIDCPTVDLIAGGGSEQAGFVQVMHGRAVNPQEMRDMGDAMTAELKEIRPDVLGGIVGWHGDRQFTQAMYFTSEAEARKAEKTMEGDQQVDEWEKMLDGDMEFIDLIDPTYD